MPTSQTMHFTPKTINAFPIPTVGRKSVFDAHTRSLGLRADSNGRKSFYWFKSANGKAMFRSLGTWPTTGIAEARADAQELDAKLSRWRIAKFAGVDPFAAPEPPKAPGQALTFGELLDRYCAKRIANHAAHPAQAEARTRWMVDKYLAAWKNWPLDTIDRRAVRARHDDIGEKHGKVMADRVIELVRRLYGWATNREEVYDGANPAARVEIFGCKSRERYLLTDELPRFFAALRAETNLDLKHFVLLSLFCGTRKSDTLSMRWQDVSLADNTWRVPQPKGNRPYAVPLVPEACEVLQERRARADSGATYVFPSFGRTGHIVEPKHAFRLLLQRAKVENLHIHDLRRTLGSWRAANGASMVVIGKSLGHAAGSGATAVYSRLDLGPVRQSIAAAVTAMKTAATPAPQPKPARKRARALPAATVAVAAK